MNNILVFNALQTSLSGGIGRYSYELARELYRVNKNCIRLVVREEDLHLFEFVEKNHLIVAKGIKNSKDRNLYEQFKLPNIIYKKYPNAIVHYPDSMAPLFSKNKVIITIHDMAFKSLKGVFPLKTVLWKRMITSLSVRKAKKIIAITEFTKNEILKYYPKLSKKISVIYNGFNDFSKEKIIEENVRTNIKSIDTPYILTVSTISPRKNIDNLIKAFNLLKDSINENLVIAGDKGWMYTNIYKLVKELDLTERVIFTGKINDDELKILYKNSKIFIYVSFYEGFGLPPLEAMSYKIPCIVSDVTSLPEVVGEGAVKVDPNNIVEISEAIIRLKKDFNYRSNILDKVDFEVSKFSWEKCSYDLIKTIYE